MTVSLGPVVGKVGGGTEIHRIDVPSYSTGDSSKDLVTVPVPTGKTAKVAVSFRVTGSGGTSATNYPTMIVGGATLQVGSSSPIWGGVVADVSGPTIIRHSRTTSSSAYAFPVTDFVVYWWLVE